MLRFLQSLCLIKCNLCVFDLKLLLLIETFLRVLVDLLFFSLLKVYVGLRLVNE